ncbi:unnamed protein product [Commensalibacter communis]|nr:unnamed protein product [Commensalibacter communis]
MSGWGDYGGFSPPTGELSYMSRSWSEQGRFVKAITNLRKDDSIRKMIDIILEDGLEFIFGYSKLPLAAQEKILQDLTNMLINKTIHSAIKFATKWQLKKCL